MDWLKNTLEEKKVILIDDYLSSNTISWVMHDIAKQQGTFTREGYENDNRLRYRSDPRNCGTKVIGNSRSILNSIWNDKSFLNLIEDPIFYHAAQTSGVGNCTLLSVYTDGDHYGLHNDIDMESIVSCVLMLSFPEATFTGGSLVIEGVEIPFRHNRLIVFPSCLAHEVTKIDNEHTSYKKQRFTIQHFISAVRVKKPLIDESSNI